MARERRSYHTINVSQMPEVVELARRIRETRAPARLEIDGEELGTLVPPKRSTSRAVTGKPLTKDDPFWGLIGAGSSGRSDISENKHTYLAEAYADLHD